jgi:malate permease and related proteins
MIAAWAGSGDLSRGMVTVFRLPILPALAAAVLVRYWTGGDATKIPRVINETARYIAGGLIPVALITLGAQLASNPRWPRWKPVSLTLVLRLIYAPIQMAATLWVLHYFAVPGFDLWPWPASLLILTASVPTGVNTLLLTLELNGDADLAADTVFWTTVFSAVTITGWLAVIKYGFGVG